MRSFTIAILILFTGSGCASMQDKSMGNQEIEINKTQTMAGATDETAQISTEISYEDMFGTIGNTAEYDILALAKTDPNLTTFVQLVEQAGMATEVSKDGPHTLFIPINNAFSELSEDSLQNLMAPEHKAQLIRLLQAHILSGELLTSSFNNIQHLESSGGDYLQLDTIANPLTLTVGGANIIKPNVRAANGIIHVVDKLMNTSEGIGRY